MWRWGLNRPPYLYMATNVDICNLALSQLGENGQVTALDPPDGSDYAAHCSNYYPIALRKLFEEFDWSFAQTRARLNKLASFDTSLYAYKNAYALPSDCVRVTRVAEAKELDSVCPFITEWPRNYEIQYSKTTDNKILLTDVDNAVLQYTIYKDAPAIFPTYFIEALVLCLAVYLVGPLKRSDAASTMAQNLRQAYQNALSEAKTIDAQNAARRKYPYIASQLRARWV